MCGPNSAQPPRPVVPSKLTCEENGLFHKVLKNSIRTLYRGTARYVGPDKAARFRTGRTYHIIATQCKGYVWVDAWSKACSYDSIEDFSKSWVPVEVLRSSYSN